MSTPKVIEGDKMNGINHRRCSITESDAILANMEPTFEGLGQRIYKLRKRRGLTQEELAAAVNGTRYGLSIRGQSHISNMENSGGDKLPSVQVLAALAEVLETNTDYLLGLTDDDAPHSDLDDQVMFGTRNEREHRRLREMGEGFLTLPETTQEYLLGIIRELKPKPPRIIGDEE
jgi:transcriptional regulator with XRE-family HTH domain